MAAPLRVGSVPYLVGRPLDSGLGREPGIELVLEPPSVLVEGLRSGRLDVALVSSIELFRRPNYGYLDGIAVVGKGFVGSVQVFLRTALEDVRRLALDPASRTARTLVRILLSKRPEGPPEYIEVPEGTDPRSVEADAWLRIGDEALREYLGDARPVFNPSQDWTERTGLPFVFANWIVRPGVEIEGYLDAFREARERGRQLTEDLAREASRTWDLPFEACHHYLAEECRYDPDESMQSSLEAFRSSAAALDLCPDDCRPSPISLPVTSAQCPD